MKFSQALKMAFSSILSNKMRSFLTMLGIIIGISSVIILIGIGEGTKKDVADSISTMGTNLITINITGGREVTVTTAELTALKSQPGIKEIAPTIASAVTAKLGNQNTTTSIESSLPSYSEIRNVTAQYGRFITQDDVDNRYRVAVVGTDVLDTLSKGTPYDSFVNQTITLNGTAFTIVGILETKGSTTAGSTDNRIIIPISTAQRLLRNKSIRTFYVEAQSPDMVNTAVATLNTFMLSKSNNQANTFRVFNQSDLLTTQTAAADSLTTMLAGVAAISLLVGGIGIMNIMLVTVTERTREIGIRKAIGAKRRDILIQFLIEAITISGIGGFLGVSIGILGGNLYSKFMTKTVVIQPNIVLLAFVFAATVGIIFGLYPANKASRLRPIDALRYE
ncbi:MAG TPA: ABC transporter permease [Clostridiaceae bacterium]